MNETFGSYRKRNILVGNGININFGGYDTYSNSAILRRMFNNIKAEKYSKLFPDNNSDEIMTMFNELRDLLLNIEHWKFPEQYLFLGMEKQRIKRQYTKDSKLEDIGMEDYFIALEGVRRPDDTKEFYASMHRDLMMLMLDAIYNDGHINEIEYGKSFGKYLNHFDNIFTTNYDSNLDKYVKGVKHLHGDFRVLSPEYDAHSEYSRTYPEQSKASTVLPEFLHVYSNAIMSWYWLEKRGEWFGNESVYGADVFNEKMTGNLEIIGISPCNDEHLFYIINKSQLNHVVYYYYSSDDLALAKNKIKKPVEFCNVEKIWNKFA